MIDSEEMVLRVLRCPRCGTEFYCAVDVRIGCCVDDKELIDTGQTVVVDREGHVSTVN